MKKWMEAIESMVGVQREGKGKEEYEGGWEKEGRMDGWKFCKTALLGHITLE